jgi:hypothetical protein
MVAQQQSPGPQAGAKEVDANNVENTTKAMQDSFITPPTAG